MSDIEFSVLEAQQDIHEMIARQNRWNRLWRRSLIVEKTATDHRIAAIVQGVITMAHHMDMTVVTEGLRQLTSEPNLTGVALVIRLT